MRRPLLLLASVLVLAFGGALAAGEEFKVTSFDKRAVDLTWQTVNDNVMGGRSRGGSAKVEGQLVFSGSTNTNGGGFSSIRAALASVKLKGSEGLELRVKGDGRTYTLMLRTDALYRRSALWYRASFKTQRDAWTNARIPFSALEARWRGMALRGPAFDPERVAGIGFMIYDKQDGAFRLEIDRIRAYSLRTEAVVVDKALSMAPYQGKKRPLILFAPHAEDERLIKQLGELRASQEAFEERDMVLVVVLEKGRSTADGKPLEAPAAAALRRKYRMAEDAFGVRLVGKDGRIKREASAPVSLEGLYTLIDLMPMRRSEMAEPDK